jgi:adenylate kinase
LQNAEGSPAEVQARIIAELSYQSAMELSDQTFEQVRRIPLASEVITNARHDLVRRLDDYGSRNTELFERVIKVITGEFMHIIRRQALSGRAIIRSENTIFREAGAIDMALDLLSERGYTITLDYNKVLIPTSVDLKTGEIINTKQRIYEFQIEFSRPTIRRGT